MIELAAPKRVLLCASTEKGLEVTNALTEAFASRLAAVCSIEEHGVVESFHERIWKRAAEAGVSAVEWRRFVREPIRTIDELGIDSMLCIGWRHMVRRSVLDRLGGQVVIAHDSLLPRLRGFVPLATALIAGERETGVTFLLAADDADSGPILWQRSVAIDPTDGLADLVRKVAPLYVEGSLRWLEGSLREASPQNEELASYSIWRDEEDFWIRWSESAATIERTVRALGPPYLGARTRLANTTVVIEAAQVVPDLVFAVRQPGKIARLDGGKPVVICGTGLLRIEAAHAEGRSILPISRLRQRFRSPEGE